MKSTPDQRSDLDWPVDAGVAGDVVARIREKAKSIDARRRQRNRRTTAVLSSVVIIACVIGGWAVPLVRDTDRIATVAATQHTVALRDGSVAELNARSELRTDFRWGRRHVRLESGEAFFAVEKDPAHPFVVTTPHGTVRVTGTKFNVRLAAGKGIEVTLLEGGVAFEAGAKAAVALTPGQQLRGSSESVDVTPLRAAAIENILAWREGRLVFDGLTLAEAAERLSEFHGADIKVAPAVAALHADGSVAIHNLAGALDALEALLPISVLGSPDSGYRIVAR